MRECLVNSLEAIDRLEKSRGQPDWEQKLRLLREAEGWLEEARKRSARLSRENGQQLAAVLYPSAATVCLELSNYLPRRSDKEKYLHRGKDYLEHLLKRDERDREAWALYGLVLEDIGLYLGPPEEYYARACDALEKAMDTQNLRAGRTQPWLDRGRVQVRWATLGGKEAGKLLNAAAEDLKLVTKFGGESVEAAEASYWQGKLAAVQKRRERAEQALAQALKLARKARSPMWEEAVLNDWCTLALAEATTLLARQHPDTTKYAGVVEAKARELEKFSKATAAWFLLNAYRARCYATLQLPSAKTLLDILARGLEEGGRFQDNVWHVYLLSERARLYLEGTEVKKEVDKAYNDAVAALKLAEQVPVPDEAKALPLGTAGEAILNYQNAWKYYPEAVAKLRKAIQLAPTNPKAFWWKGLLAFTLSEEKFEAQGEDAANRWEEAARCIEEVFQTGPKKTLDSMPFLQKLRKDIPQKALPILQNAVKEHGQAADAWKWHWRIAEILAARGERLAALPHIRQAEHQIPASAPAAQRDRIVALRKQLEEGQ
jgi:tetratricopeptide (TPR) repeat protein